MVTHTNEDNERPAWFVGASFGGTNDQTERFIRDGIWENGYTDGRYFDLVNDIQPGDRIAIKAAYPRNNPDGLPFDAHGYSVSAMVIKATGIVKENMGNGRRLRVDWASVSPPRTFYFSSYWKTVHRIVPDNWRKASLIAFTFDNQLQDIDRWRNDPQYRERFGDRNPIGPAPQPEPQQLSDTYTLDSILDDGCFLDEITLEWMLHRLQTKQNIILQGPPGAGKTWLSKRLAYTLIGHKDDDKVRQVQFHPNLSYEDFVRGWRPQGDGKLELVDGPFLKLADDARNDPDGKYVMVIEEINRGNPASIFGELLTLLEADKRSPNDALALAYPRDDSERFHIPPNVYVIGTMNLADRSLALVDFALRRRFAFFDLEPQLNYTWREWVHEESGIPDAFLADIAARITALNDQIVADRNLGPQFRIGHSHVTPPPDTPIDNPQQWFTDVVETEIAPLLREYWFDDIATADDAIAGLLNGLP